MKRTSLALTLAAVTGLWFAGCARDPLSPSAPTTSDSRPMVEQALTTMPELSDNDTYLAPGEAEFADGYAPSSPDRFSIQEAIRPVFFFRVIREHQRDLHIDIERDSTREIADVLVVDRFAGTLALVALDSTDSGVARRIVRKPLRDIGRLRARLAHRLDAGGDSTAADARGWRLIAVSNRQIASPEHATQVRSVRLETRSGLDVTITDPLELMRFPEGLPRVDAGEWVKVTVTTADPSDAVFLLAGWGRQRMRATADGRFVGAFRAPVELRLFRLGVNALDRATLFDDRAPYDSDFWGLLGRTGIPHVAALP